ncbi:helix-turn-helix domain-containing protein, partial [Desulfofundulus sp.]|uniref:helix-turn-helix domain-containing protein n=1 Tax=Desulfofundulus sp. TaxID=2282750 RepID=UPI003C71B975
IFYFGGEEPVDSDRESKVVEFPGTRNRSAADSSEPGETGASGREKAGEKTGKPAERASGPDREKPGDKDKKNPFAKRLRQLIKERDIRVTDLAWGSGVAPKTIYSFLNGTTFPSVETLLNMSAYLGVSVDYLLGKTDEPTGIALEEGEEYEEILTIRRLYRQLSEKERNIIKTLLRSMVEEGKLD